MIEVSQLLASVLSPFCHFTAKFYVSKLRALNLGAMNELVGGRDSELLKIELYAKMCIYVPYVHFPKESS